MKKNKINALLVGILLTVTALASCSSDSNREENEATTTITKEYEIVDMLEVIRWNGYGDESMSYILLENGDIKTLGASQGPYTKEEARKIMDFRRGERVTIKVEETVPVK